MRRLRLNAGAQMVRRAEDACKEDELWVGDGFDPGQPGAPSVPVYVRIGPPRMLVAELVCGRLARQLGLPAPEVFLVTVPAGTLSGSQLLPLDADHLCVGTFDLGGEDFAQLLSHDAPACQAILAAWPHLGHVLAFDEWTANLDRNLGNLVYAARQVHIIDHAEGLGGHVCDVEALAKLVNVMLVNKLGDLFVVANDRQKNRLLKQLGAWLIKEAAAVDVPRIVQAACLGEWHTIQQDVQLIDFVQQRLLHTHTLLCKRLGQRQMHLPFPAMQR